MSKKDKLVIVNGEIDDSMEVLTTKEILDIILKKIDKTNEILKNNK